MQHGCYQQSVHIAVWIDRSSRHRVHPVTGDESVRSKDRCRAKKSGRRRRKKLPVFSRGEASKEIGIRRLEKNSCTSVHRRFPQGCPGPYSRLDADLARFRQSSTIAIHSNDNDLWKTFLLRFVSGFSRLPSPSTAVAVGGRVDRPAAPRPVSLRRHHFASRAVLNIMHLVSCASPHDPLEAAPRTALLEDVPDGARWDGFWAADVYYVRCTMVDGTVAWFQLADEEPVASRPAEPRVLSLRPRTRVFARQAVVVAQSPNGRRMLVGSARRQPR